MVREVAIRLADGGETAGLLEAPERCAAALVLAHGAGAGMRHRFMAAVSAALAERGVATLRFDFPAMHRGAKMPDRPPVAQAAVRAAVARMRDLVPVVPLFAGGKSFGGRMTSQAQADAPLPGVAGLVFLGFPLHPPGKPGVTRAEHLRRVRIPTLFVQGSRDALAGMTLLRPVITGLDGAALCELAEADHSFHVAAKTGLNDAAVLRQAADAIAAWMRDVAGQRSSA